MLNSNFKIKNTRLVCTISEIVTSPSMLWRFRIFYFFVLSQISDTFTVDPLSTRTVVTLKPYTAVRWTPVNKQKIKTVLTLHVTDSQEQNDEYFSFCFVDIIWFIFAFCGSRTGRNRWEKSIGIYLTCFAVRFRT